MTQSIRQSELFASQDWQVLYQAFRQINFNASDPATIGKALREYIQTYYAEDFSDWIESSEFVAVIELLSWLAGVLAYKTDINARENFLETAQARESVLRLARFLSYNPRRNQPARGLMKLVAIETDDDVYDAFGTNLANRQINWSDDNNPDWFEDFVLILNNAFVSTNPFGLPLKAGTYAGVRTQLYRLNARFGDNATRFQASVSGTSMSFETINTDFDETLGFTERTPNIDSAIHLLYRTDGKGNGSSATGFFTAIKQGQIFNQDYVISTPVENQIINLNIDNINQSDVWVQTLDKNGAVSIDWQKVPAIVSQNITFNSFDASDRNIFSVITRDRDQVSIRFADGRFGAAPVGTIRVWYRVSNGRTYQVRPQELQDVRIPYTFINRRGVRKTLYLTYSLFDTISNASARETEDQIRARAPMVYATQNRMVSGEDYNTFPLQSNLATKLKAVSRVYSGHSNYIDLNDPTGTYKDLNIFSDDGLFYKLDAPGFTEVPLTDNRGPSELITSYITPMLRSTDVGTYMRDLMQRDMGAGALKIPNDIAWSRAADGRFANTGSFTAPHVLMRPGASVLFTKGGKTTWVSILDVFNDAPTTATGLGVAGNVVLSRVIESGSTIVTMVPRYVSTLDPTLRDQIAEQIELNLSFTLWYDYGAALGTNAWSVQPIGAGEIQSGTKVRVLKAEYLSNLLWRFSAPGLKYVFESLNNVRFFFDGAAATDGAQGQAQVDLVRVLDVNTDLRSTSGAALGRIYDLTIDQMVQHTNGRADQTRIYVLPRDADRDGYADDPDTYGRLVSPVVEASYLFWSQDSAGTFVPDYAISVYVSDADRAASIGVATGTVAYQINGAQPGTFWRKTTDSWERLQRGYRAARGRGPNVAAHWFKIGGVESTANVGSGIRFQWKHYAPTDRRLDPATSNVIDMFVLTTDYDNAVRSWIAGGAKSDLTPVPPTETDIRSAFAEYESSKVFTDDIVWRPVKYKYLFGQAADPELRCSFKVVKLPNTTINDGEIKTRVIRAINEYFSADFWDFGDTFYFTEMAAFVHQRLATVIASIVPVSEAAEGTFGDGIQIGARSDEILISTAQVTDVIIIDSNTPANLRMI